MYSLRFSALAKDKQSASKFGAKMQLKDQKKNLQALVNQLQSERDAESEVNVIQFGFYFNSINNSNLTFQFGTTVRPRFTRPRKSGGLVNRI